MIYNEFAVWIRGGENGVYLVDKLDEAGGPPVQVMVTASGHWKELSARLCAPSTMDNLSVTERMAGWKKVGKELAGIALPPEVPMKGVRSLFQAACAEAHDRDQGIRLRILVEASDLRGAPWEALWLPDTGQPNSVSGHVALDSRVSLVRSSGSAIPKGPLFQEGTVDVLFIGCGHGRVFEDGRGKGGSRRICRLGEVPDVAAAMYPAWQAIHERQSPRFSAFGPLLEPTAEALKRRLRNDRPQVAVVFGHGVLLDRDQFPVMNPFTAGVSTQGCLLLAPDEESITHGNGLESTVGQPFLVRDIVSGINPPRLWILANCDLAWQAADFKEGGARAILAMQSMLTQDVGRQLVAEFSGWLADGRSIEEAVADLRRRLAHDMSFVDPRGIPYWLAPVLLLDAADGTLRSPIPGTSKVVATPDPNAPLMDWMKGLRDNPRFVSFDSFRLNNPLQFADAYVPLRIEREVKVRKGTNPLDDRGADSRPLDPAMAHGIVDLLDRWNPTRPRARVAIFGEGGWGKSLMLRHACHVIARQKPAGWFPVLFSLPELYNSWKNASQDVRTLDRAIEHHVIRSPGVNWPAACGRLWDAMRAWRCDHNVLLLLDSLEEISDDLKAQMSMDEFVSTLLAQAERWPGPVVLASRPGALDAHRLSEIWTSYRIRLPGDTDEEEEPDGPASLKAGPPAAFIDFLQHFLKAPGRLQDDKRHDLVEGFRKNWSVLKGLRAPLMLELMAALKREVRGFRLPAHRETLFEHAVRFLVARKPPFVGFRPVDDAVAQASRALEALGWVLTDLGREFSAAILRDTLRPALAVLRAGEPKRTAEPLQEAVDELLRRLRKAGSEGSDAAILAAWMTAASGLLMPAGTSLRGQVYEWIHQTLGQYLVLRGLTEVPAEVVFHQDAGVVARRSGLVEHTIPLLANMFYRLERDPQGSEGPMDAMLRNLASDAQMRDTLARELLQHADARVRHPVARALERHHVEIVRDATGPPLRVNKDQLLERLPPVIVNDRDGSEMVLVPGGTYPVGDELNGPAHTVQLLPFYIGRYTVTVAQFRRFLHDEPFHREIGYRFHGTPDECWPFKRPRPNAARGNRLDWRPALNLRWIDAIAYCRWAVLRLPTEAEWEAAGRGEKAHAFPWGDAWEAGRCCNSVGQDTGWPVRVDFFEMGKSWCGCFNMAGNAWEWTSSVPRPYEYDAMDGRENPEGQSKRILRGGSWNCINPLYFRAAHRHVVNATDWNVDFSFRVARTP